MRKTQRVVSGGVKAFLWLIKGLLLLLAAAALILWPTSQGCSFAVVAEHATFEPQTQTLLLVAGCRNGRIVIGRNWAWHRDRQTAGPLVAGWRWKTEQMSSIGNAELFWSAFGPIRWKVKHEIAEWPDSPSPDSEYDERVFAAPCWLVAPTLAAWPLTSIGLLIRRRKQRFRNRQGCCHECGYDLRATPEKTGPLVERCPECGAFTATTSTP